ncbi:hypothetical protein ACFVVA_16760 [Kitasatospora sp. NPDC058048]|uniref:hypothetical protein n=1 Tax=Kitasatospora sp. NPDC058048 TaxID=3346313 RepID=UPI0036DF79E6
MTCCDPRLKAIRSPFRSQPAGRTAVLVPAMLRHDQRLLDLAGGNSVPESTLRRWRDEMIDLLAAKAPRLDRALRRIAARGEGVVLIDGTLIPTQRRTGKANRPNYSGKHRRRETGDRYYAALRNLFNRTLGRLRHCLTSRQKFDETFAFTPPKPSPLAAAA